MEFTPKQKHTLLSKMGYTGSADSDSMEQFIQSQPGVAAKMGKFQRALTRGFEGGGRVTSSYSNVSPFYQTTPVAPTTTTTTPEPEATPTIPEPEGYTSPTVAELQEKAGITPEFLAQEKVKVDTSKSDLDALEKEKADFLAKYPYLTDTHPTVADFNKKIATATEAYNEAQEEYSVFTDPKKLLEPYRADVAAKAITDPSALIKAQEVAKVTPTAETTIDPSTGQVVPLPEVTAETVTAKEAEAPEEITAETIEAEKVSPEIEKALEDLEAAKGMVSKEGTVRGQLELLMEDFEGGGTPPWASGAMRQAMGVMQQRGLGASSMAGQAVVQAAMESAIGIATQDAATVAQFEMQNLNNEQQTLIFKTQQRISGLLSDQAVENAARQFNATSENQTNQFMANLNATVSQFNAAQVNAISQFNAGEKNAFEQFNTQIKDQRDRFNAQNSLVIAQANAQWRQNIETINTAQQNEANRQTAANVNALTAAALDNYWQEERDTMAFAFQETENALDRDLQLLLGQMGINAEMAMQKSGQKFQSRAALGSLAFKVLGGGSGGTGLLGKVFGF
jgi:hypothetical protein